MEPAAGRQAVVQHPESDQFLPRLDLAEVVDRPVQSLVEAE